jgi:biopolymer transport protein ExbB
MPRIIIFEAEERERRIAMKPMIERAKDLLVEAGAVWVLWLLVALSVASLAVAIDRARLFLAEREDLESLSRDLHRLLALGDTLLARRRLQSARSVAARVVLAGLTQWEEGASPASAERAMAAAAGLERAHLQRRLLFLGTVGSNAPFVGLLGTVIGIVGAFDALGDPALMAADALAPERVMSTIAEALVATAAGLVVAIPAVALFNYFQGALAVAISNAETLGQVLLTHIGRELADGRSGVRAAAVGEP